MVSFAITGFKNSLYETSYKLPKNIALFLRNCADD